MGIANYIGGINHSRINCISVRTITLHITFIAENVRAGILGVDKGQKEAAASIGLTNNQILRLIVATSIENNYTANN